MIAKTMPDCESWEGLRRISALGEPLLELQPTELGELRVAFGGDVANSMVCLARILPPSAYKISLVTALGNSAYSRWLRERLERERIELSEPSMAGEPGLYGLPFDFDRSASFSYWRSNSAARAFLGAADPSQLLALLDAPQLLLITGITLALCSTSVFEGLCQWIEIHRKDCRVVFDCNFRRALWSSETEARSRTRAFEQLASVIATGVDDEKNLWGVDAPGETIQRLSRHGAEYLIRGGNQGCWVGKGDEWRHVATKPVSPVDTAGAGDAHLAGYIAGRICGCPRIEAAGFANEIAAMIVTQRGSAPGADAPFPDLPIR